MSEKKIKSRKPARKLYIDQHKSAPTSIEFLPKNRVNEVMRAARIYYTNDKACTILSQELPLGLLSLITHQFFPKQDMILIPFAANHILTLHFMMGQSISVTTFNGDLEKLLNNNIALYNIESKYNIAEVAAGVAFYSMHVNINIEMVRALVNKHPELSVLLEDKVMKAKGRVNKEVYIMNDIAYYCLSNIVSCKFVDQAAADYRYRQALNLLSTFANRYNAKEGLGMMPDQEDEGVINTCFKFLYEKYSKRFTLKQLAERYDMPARKLNAGFLAIYGMKPGCYQLMLRMNYAYERLCMGESLAEVAKATGYRAVHSFKEAFNTYFNTNVELVHTMQ